MNSTFGVLILAGGSSTRMNFPKPFLPLKGKTFLENIVNGYLDFGVKHITLVLNHLLAENLPVSIKNNGQVQLIINQHPVYGRTYSVMLGLKALPDQDYTFFHNVDNPFPGRELLEQLFKERISYGFVVPSCNGKRGHPLLLSKNLVRDILSRENEFGNLRDALKIYPMVTAATSNTDILLNINTPADYATHIANLTRKRIVKGKMTGSKKAIAARVA